MANMALSNVIRGKISKPIKALLYGTEGVGKSTFAAGAPDPIFLCSEDGTGNLDVARFPMPDRWEDVLCAVNELHDAKHEFKTFVIDTVDWLEPLCWDYIIRTATADRQGNRPKSIEDVNGGFGKGYVAATDQWRFLLSQFERLQNDRGMHIVLLAHSWIKPFANPEGENFDRYELKINKQAAGKIKEWCNAVLFAQYDTAVVSKQGKTRGVATGARIMRTERRAAFDAKNRYGLPFSMPLDWNEFFAAVQSGQAVAPEKLIAEARALGASAGITEQVEGLITRANGDSDKLGRLVDWVRGRIQIAEEQ